VRLAPAGDQFLILASDGLLEKLSPDEVCATAAALAAGRPPPAQPAQAPAAIALGPMDGDAAVPPPQPPPPAAVGESPLGGCRPRSGIVACVDCCPGRQTGGAAPQRPASLAQAVAHALQEAAYARTALDNIVVLVIPLQRCGHPPVHAFSVDFMAGMQLGCASMQRTVCLGQWVLIFLPI